MAQDVNTRLPPGALNARIGHTHVNLLFSCLDVPTVSHVTFKTRERGVGKAVELVANEICANESFLNSCLKISPLLRAPPKRVFEWNHWLLES